MNRISVIFAVLILTALAVIFNSCAPRNSEPEPGTLTSPEANKTTARSGFFVGDRGKSIPADVVKIIPDLDKYPPVIHSAAYQAPVHMPGPVNTAGAEDSPFILPDGRTFYFFFTPDVRIPAEKQLLDGVTGIYKSTKTDAGIWSEPELIVSHFAGEPSLDGAGNLYFVHHFYRDNVMLEADIYFAARK